MPDRVVTAADLRSAAEALHRAGGHCLIAADHLDADDVPRMAAHAFAALGDLHRGSAALDDAAERHARHSSTDRPSGDVTNPGDVGGRGPEDGGRG